MEADEIGSELISLHPATIVVTIGKHRVWRFSDETPAHKYESVVSIIADERLIELTARDSFDEDLAEFMLDRMEGQKLPPLESNMLSVLPARFPDPWEFDCIVVVPPGIARRFEHQSDDLQAVTSWAIPAFSGEFADADSGKEFWHQLRRKDGWNLAVIRWDRSRKTVEKFE